MNIELIIQDSQSGSTWEVSDLVSGSITWETGVAGFPGKLSFSVMDDDTITISEGSPVSFKVDGRGVFFGYVFTKGKTKTKKIPITAYDQLRYLKNKDTYVFSGITASQAFTKICSDYSLTCDTPVESEYLMAPRVHDNKTLFEILQYGIDQTLINAGNWFMIYDNFGTLRFTDINYLKTDLFIGDESLLVDYDLKTSIDDDTYNQIKLIKENKDSAKREVYIVKDSSTIKQWGTLQYFEKMDEKANEAQIQERAERLLRLKNRTTKKLKLIAMGDFRVRAGSGIVIGIKDIVKDGIAENQYFMVTECTHSFSNNTHVMALELQVSI